MHLKSGTMIISGSGPHTVLIVKQWAIVPNASRVDRPDPPGGIACLEWIGCPRPLSHRRSRRLPSATSPYYAFFF
jgi:hypothetical protein